MRILILAGLLAMPQDPVEAARVDGCTPWQTFRHVIWPYLMPFAYIAMTIRSLDVARAYDIVKIMTDGGPARRTELIWTLVGRTAYSDAQMGACQCHGLCRRSFSPSLFTVIFFRKLAAARARIGASGSHGPIREAMPNTVARRRIARVFYLVGLFLAMLVACLPGFWIVLSSLRPPVEIMAKPPVWIPQDISLDAYRTMFSEQGRAACRSGIISAIPSLFHVTSTVVSLIIGMSGGYALCPAPLSRQVGNLPGLYAHTLQCRASPCRCRSSWSIRALASPIRISA